MNRLGISLLLALPTALIGCGGSSDSSSLDSIDPLFQATDTGPFNLTQRADLAFYLFHANTRGNRGEISYQENFYSKAATELGPITTTTVRHLNTGTSIDEITFDEMTIDSDDIRFRFNFDDDTITQVNPMLGDAFQNQRFVMIDDTIYDFRSELTGFEERCEFVEHFEEFNLSSATGATVLSSASHEDVIKVLCVSRFVTDAGIVPNWIWNKYYAKNVGIILIDGNWQNDLGQIYMVPEY